MFKIFLLLVAVSVGQIQSATIDENSKAERILEDLIYNGAECLRGELKNGIPEHNVPSFNPLLFENMSVVLDDLFGGVIGGYLTIRNFMLNGITDFILSNVKGSIGIFPPRYEFDGVLEFSELILDTEYDCSVSNDLYENIFGTGTISSEVNGLIFKIKATVKILGGISISNFELWASLNGLSKFEITGLTYGEKDVSETLSEYIKSNASTYIQENAELINEIANEILNDFTTTGEDGLFQYILNKCIGL